MKEIQPVRLSGTVMGGSYHPAWEHKAPPAVTPSQEPSWGRRTTDQTSKQHPDPVPLTSGPGGPTGPGGPCQTELQREQLQEQPVLSAVYSDDTLISNAESGKVSWLPSCWPLHWALDRYICLLA